MLAEPAWLLVGAKVERELDDLCDIWAPARVTEISESGVLVEYEDGLTEAGIPFSELRPVSELSRDESASEALSHSAAKTSNAISGEVEAVPEATRETQLAELQEVIQLWTTSTSDTAAVDTVGEMHNQVGSQDYRDAMAAGSQQNVICTNGIIMHEASMSSRHCKLALQYGNILWIAGAALAKFLSWHATDNAESSLHRARGNVRVLELGAGTGVVGLTLARLGAAVTFTDNEAEVIALLERNIQANELGEHAHTHLLDFGDPATYLLEEFDVIVAADVLYTREQTAKLAHTLNAHVMPGMEVFLSYEKRKVCHQAFFTQVMSMGFEVERLEDISGHAVWDATYMAAQVYSRSLGFAEGDVPFGESFKERLQ